MRPLFLPRLVNGPFEDPVLFVPFQFQRRAVLFDLGDLSCLPPRDLLKVSHVFVTHTHMDHFIGFDRLLRCLLGRRLDLHLYGPAGFLSHVEGKLAGYSWDLLDRRTCGMRLIVHEVHPQRILRRCFIGGDRFAAAGDPVALPFTGLLVREPAFEVSTAVLQHSIPCLGLALTERFHVNILKTGLTALGLTPGPWLTRFKNALYEGVDPSSAFEIDPANDTTGGRLALQDLQRHIARISAGQKIAYITDVGDSALNRAAIRSLAQTADLLFIEGAFLHSDRERAVATSHLTARGAGEIAALAGARRFTIFHFSPRYRGREADLMREAQKAYDQAIGQPADI